MGFCRLFTTEAGAVTAKIVTNAAASEQNGECDLSAWPRVWEPGNSHEESTSIELTQEAAAHFQTVGLAEHASVASFSRATLEMMEHGAPANLLDRTLVAAREEIKHAKMAFALAKEFAARPFHVGKLNGELGIIGGNGLVEFAERTIREACIGETQAVLQAAASRRFTSADGRVGEYVRAVFSEEMRHAELAWATVQWSILKTYADGGDADAAQDMVARVEKAIASGVAKLRSHEESGKYDARAVERLRKFGMLPASLESTIGDIAASLLKQFMPH